MKKFCCIIALGLLACACEIPFSIDDISEPRFFVEFIPAAGDVATTLKVAYADPAYGEKPKGFYSLNSNDIRVEVNDKRLAPGSLVWENEGNKWTTQIEGKFVPGDKVSVSVESAGAPTATGTTVVPEEPRIASIDITKSDDKEDSDGRRVVVKLDRDVADGEYYGIEITVVEEFYTAEMVMGFPPTVRIDTTRYDSHITPGQVASMSDINNMDLDAFASISYNYGGLVSEGSFYMLGGLFISDYRPMSLLGSRQFDGNTYSFYINADLDFSGWLDGIDYGDYGEPDYTPEIIDDEPEEPGDEEEPEEPEDPEIYRIMLGMKHWYRIELFRLSEELYNYCKAQYLMDYNILANFGVTPPNFTYSNIMGGLGLVGGISRCSSELIPDPWNKDPEIPGWQDFLNL